MLTIRKILEYKIQERITKYIRRSIISLLFILQSYFKIPRNVKLNTTHKWQTGKSFNKFLLIIHLILTLKSFKIDRKCTAGLYSLLVIDTKISSNNALQFQKNLLEEAQIVVMTKIIRNEKFQNDINGAVAKISVLSRSKTDEDEEIWQMKKYCPTTAYDNKKKPNSLIYSSENH